MCWIGLYKIGEQDSQKIQTTKTSFFKIQWRWPDRSYFEAIDDKIILWFHRLAIMDLSAKWDQPFVTKTDKWIIYTLCNGEIYNYHEILDKYKFQVKSGSDCEVIPFLYQLGWIAKVVEEIRGEFAFLIYDTTNQTIYTGRDPIGVRPLFFGKQKKWTDFGFCSQLKWLSGLYDEVEQFGPGTYMSIDLQTQEMTQKDFYSRQYIIQEQKQEDIEDKIRTIFTQTVRKRLMSDRPVGCLLSGWLDSSICSAIAQKYSSKPIKTFTIGLKWATDIPFAQTVAKYIWSDHTTFEVTMQEALDAIDQTIYTIESFDITTVRASTWQYLLAKKIKEQTDVKVLICGELSDELMWWYKYFHKAPDEISFDAECRRLVADVFWYDGLRTDRTMSQNGLEVRLPFADVDFVDYFFGIPTRLRMPKDWVEKYLFRKAFDSTDLLPKEILWRSKEALSDGTSSKTKSWFEVIQEHIDTIISDEEFAQAKKTYKHCPPQLKEAYYYRKKFGHNRQKWVDKLKVFISI